MTLKHYLKQQLQAQDPSLYRQRRTHANPQQIEQTLNGQPLINFCSNDYLGLANNSTVKQALQQGVESYGVGAGAAHLISGHQQPHHALEKMLAQVCKREQALLFSTGYMANIGVLSALLQRGDAVFMDKLNHASLIDAVQLSPAKRQRYRHGDMQQLEEQLARSDAKHKLIVSDGVFSMDGDMADIAVLQQLAKRYDAWLMIDDAHGFGVLGSEGQGSIAAQGLPSDSVDIYMATLGKALGTFGAFVAGDNALIDWLVQRARSYIYTTASPAALAKATQVSLDLMQHSDKRARLADNIAYFRAQVPTSWQLLPSDSAIQALIVKDSQKALDLSAALYQRGFWVTAIRPPTVPQHTARLRITLSAAHKKKQIKHLIETIQQLLG